MGGTLTGGTLRVLDGSLLRIKSGPAIATNNASIDLIGPTSMIEDAAANDLLQGLTSNGGSFSISGGRNFSESFPLTNSGSVTVGSTSQMTLPNFTQTGGSTTVDGTLQSPVTTSGGVISGSGTIVGDVGNGGVVAPGDPLGPLTISGNYSQPAGGALQIDVGGNPASGTFDVLNVTGDATISGALTVTDVNGFNPTSGMTYVILNCAGNLTGTFTSVPDPNVWQVIYAAHSVSIRAVVQTTILPSSYSIFRGRYISGGLSDLLASDDMWLRVALGLTLNPNEAPVQVIVSGTSPNFTPTQLQFQFEAHASEFGLTQTIDLWDFVANQYVRVDTRIASTADSITTITATNPGRFIEAGTGQVKARVAWIALGPIAQFPWQIAIDRSVWFVQ